jgi:Spx/MgsR family transcriptional regulator
MTIVVYGIANCDTVKRARAWLTEQGRAHRFHDFKKLGLPEDRLLAWEQVLGWQKLLNRQGTSWRKLDPAQQAGAVDAASALALLRAQPSLVKRPVVEWAGGQISVGFQAPDWAARLAADPV